MKHYIEQLICLKALPDAPRKGLVDWWRRRWAEFRDEPWGKRPHSPSFVVRFWGCCSKALTQKYISQKSKPTLDLVDLHDLPRA